RPRNEREAQTNSFLDRIVPATVSSSEPGGERPTRGVLRWAGRNPGAARGDRCDVRVPVAFECESWRPVYYEPGERRPALVVACGCRPSARPRRPGNRVVWPQHDDADVCTVTSVVAHLATG